MYDGLRWKRRGGSEKKDKSMTDSQTLVKYLDQIIFIPEFHGQDGQATISIFEENSLTTTSYHVPLDQIGVTIFGESKDNETKVQLIGIKSLVIKYANAATILVPPSYGDDVMVWVRHLTKLKNEYKEWQASRPRPRRVLPPEK
jgi:hypothetical protein